MTDVKLAVFNQQTIHICEELNREDQKIYHKKFYIFLHPYSLIGSSH